MDVRSRDVVTSVLKALLPAVSDRYDFQSVLDFLGAFEELGPYRVFDRVEFVRTPVCGGGWADSKHFLVAGGQATVVHVHWFPSEPKKRLKSGWVVSLVFDDESWIPTADFLEQGLKKGIPVPVPLEKRHSFWFEAQDVRALASETVLESDPDNLGAQQL